MTNVLVTGGAGYIGSVLVPALLDHNFAVTVVDNFMYGQDSLSAVCYRREFTLVRGDVRSKETMRPLLKAADTNSGYGVGEAGKHCTEETPIRPVSRYGRDKVEAERILHERHPAAISFRLATVFGMSPRMRLDLLVNDFTYRACTDRSIVLFESHFKRNFIHVRDVARVFLHGIDRFEAMKGQVYNAGLSDANLSKLELCQRIQKQVPSFVIHESDIGRDPDQRDYIVSNEKLERTGFTPAFSLDDGIRELIKGFAMIRDSKYSNV
jgi:nucleoside-diphosphate-sugar epimerase